MEDNILEEVIFYHEMSAEKNRKHRRADAVNWRRDRNKPDRYPLADRKLCKRMLHKQNRKNEDISSSTYYKTGWSLGSVSWGLT